MILDTPANSKAHMKLRLSILLLAAALAAAPAAGQTIKSLGFNTTNGQIVYSGTNTLTFTNSSVIFSNIQLGIFGSGSDTGFVGRNSGGLFTLYGTNVSSSVPAFYGWSGSQNTAFSAGTARTNLGLGATNSPTFRNLTLDGGTVDDAVGLVMLNSSGPWSIFSIAASDSPSLDQVGTDLRLGSLYVRNDGRLYQKIGGAINDPSEWGQLLYLDADGGATNARSSLGLATTNNVTFSNITASGTLAVSNTATFSTNVSIAGSLSVGSFTTTTPSTWALDATETAAATNGVLTLPSNANVLRITNANTISGVSNGILGAFYFLINQSGTNVVISNSATITARGATNITLGANESATLISTTATNATAH